MYKNRIEIKSDNDLEDIINDMYHEFLDELRDKDWATRPVDDEELIGDNDWQYIWNEDAHQMIDRYCRRMGNLFDKYSCRSLHLSSPLFQEG